MASPITKEYQRFVSELGYDSKDVESGLVNGDAMRRNRAGDGLDERRFRYAAVLDPVKLGVTDVFEINGTPCIYMKSLAAEPTSEEIHRWHRTAWNHGLGRMLWVVTPTSVQIFNSFSPPPKADDYKRHPAELLKCDVENLEQLRKYELDRISMESGQFWATSAGKRISRDQRIDAELVNDLQSASLLLIERGCAPKQAYRLMLRTLFISYLEARGVLPRELFEGLNATSFGEVLSRAGETKVFFERMRDTFNGDLFPPPPTGNEGDNYSYSKSHLEVARAIVTHTNLHSGQQSFDFWRYDFEVIPIELISSIYEDFIYKDDRNTAKARGTHYTPVNLVDLVFSQVFDDQLFSQKLPTDAKVLDLACGSGVFLVDAYRRLVARRMAAGEKLTRTLVRDVLTRQIYGLDVSETAVEIAAFSLCLTAFELDPLPDSTQHLKFRHSLKGRNLFVGDAFEADQVAGIEAFETRQFSVVVGNPPWNKPKGARSTAKASSTSHIDYCRQQDPPIELPFRSPIDQAFIWRSRDFLHSCGRIGLILDAKNFFSQEKQSRKSKRQLFSGLRARAMLNLSVLHNKKLFPTAEQPAMVFIAENSHPKTGDKLVFASAERTETFRKHGIVELFLERLSFLPLDRVTEEPHLFKIASYGTPRDRAIVEYLNETCVPLNQTIKSWKSAIHQGFIRGNLSRTVPDGFPERKLEDQQLVRFCQPVSSLAKFNDQKLQWPRSAEIYQGPVCLVQQSLFEDRLVASVSSESVTYSATYFGLPFKRCNREQFEAVCVYLNSSTAIYVFMMTATRFGIDKQIAMPNDIARLPFRVEFNSENIHDLAKLCDSSIKLKVVDEAVFDFFEFEQWQRDYITDTIRYDLDFVRHGSNSNGILPPNEDDLRSYVDTIIKHLRGALAGGELTINGDVITGLPDLSCVMIRFDEGRNRGVRCSPATDNSFSSRLANLLNAPLTSTVQLRRSLVHFDDDRCIIVKLPQKRFWSRARAYDDADTILEELCRGGE